MNHPDDTEAQIEQAFLRDRHRLRRQWQRLARQPDPEKLAEFQRRLEKSLRTVRDRQSRVPRVVFDQDLPILAHRNEIASLIQKNQVVVIAGETGSGKSTQLPKICLDAGFGIRGLIGHTQPRRIAARSIASRLADELHCPLGEAVGYKVRFSDATRDDTYIKLMTDGILLAETQGDRFLDQYEVIIIDEAHERSLNIDFLLGYLFQLLPRRPELRVIITSATIDAERFAEHFGSASGPAPAMEVSGRSYPVEVRYRPLVLEKDGEFETTDELTGIVNAVTELAAIDRGHMLVFLPTERDIRETAKRLRGINLPGDGTRRTEILPLYARLSAKEQNRVFQPQDYRRIVLATNVAESSLTVPGIRYVIDTGTARISRYAPRSKVQRLPIEDVSRASADQRMGRCGRVAAGICIRLFSEEDYLARPEFTTPEIQRTNLAAVILRAKALKLGNVEDFPFIDPPRPESVRDGYRTLYELGAIDESNALTPLGRQLSRLPVDPRIARIIVEGNRQRCLDEILIIAAALEVQDPRERPHDKKQHADQQHAQFKDEQSDFIALLNIWDFYHQAKEELTKGQLRRLCIRNFLSFNRMREWTEIHRQLMQLARDMKFEEWKRPNRKQRSDSDDRDSIHRSLLSGFLSGVAYRSGDHEYTGAGGVKFFLWPGSGLFKSKPSWCLVEEIIETQRRYGRTVAAIKPQWIEPLAEHLVKRHHVDPHWHRKSGRVMVWESVTLFGLPIVSKRRIPYDRVDPGMASEIFIREGLAKQQLECQDKFYQQNEATIEECRQLAAKARRADWIIDEYTLYRFYNERLPADVFDMKSLRRWIKASPSNRQSIRMHVADLLESDETEWTRDTYPDEVQLGSLRLPLQYAFQPGSDEDGLTVTVPQDALGQLSSDHAEWLVPGLIEEKIVALIRSLPKNIRRGLIPAPDTARQVAKQIEHGSGNFFRNVIRLLSNVAGEPIPPQAFRLEKLPPHLRMNIRVVDGEGATVAEGRDLQQLRDQLKIAESVEVESDVPSESIDVWTRDGILEWDFGELPKRVTIQRGGIEMAAYPTIVDRTDHVDLRLLNSADLSRQRTRAGIRRLYVLQQKKNLRSQLSWLPRFEEVCVMASQVVSRENLLRQTRDLLADRAFFQSREKLPRDHEMFAARLENAVERIGIATQEVAKLLPRLFESYHAARLALEEFGSKKFQHALVDGQRQIQALFAGDFLLQTPWVWLSEFPRYLKAIAYRMERLSSSLDRDRMATQEIACYWEQYEQRRKSLASENRASDELVTYRWMLEEYRVSRFAQPLGTLVTVSPQRLEKQWQKVLET